MPSWSARPAVIEDNVSILHAVTLGGTGKADRRPPSQDALRRSDRRGRKILGNIEIGHCSRIAAGSVVLNDVPPNRTVAGVPAKVVGYAGCAEPARRDGPYDRRQLRLSRVGRRAPCS